MDEEATCADFAAQIAQPDSIQPTHEVSELGFAQRRIGNLYLDVAADGFPNDLFQVSLILLNRGEGEANDVEIVLRLGEQYLCKLLLPIWCVRCKRSR